MSTIANPTLDDLIDKMRPLQLPHLRRELTDVIHTAQAQRWDVVTVLNALVDIEIAGRARVSLTRRLKALGVPETKTFDTFDADLSTIKHTTLDFLSTLEWVDRNENLVLAGPAGTGKTHLLQALSRKVVEHGGTACWMSINELEQVLISYRVDHTVDKKIAKIAKHDLVVIDDIGMLPVSDTAAEGFYRIIEACYEDTSLAVSTNLHPSNFDQLMPPTIATAAIDRLMHHAHLCVTEGESVRMSQALAGQGVGPM